MKRLLWLIWLPALAAASQSQTPAPAAGEPSYCPECHRLAFASFRRSRMASAARTPDFLREWTDKGRPERCLACHAPGGGEGVECRDCHGDTGHPYPRLETPEVCAPCHDAPGELTLRSYRRSAAARRGEGCEECHLENRGGENRDGSHDFVGPTRPGYLQDVARLHLSLRRDDGADILLVGIRHRAGHALPGGTTGRSVWLLVESLSPQGRIVSISTRRFGWTHDPDRGWKDRTLPPGPGRVVEIPLKSGTGASSMRARLIYRFKPGPLELPDPREVELDRAGFALPAEMVESR